MTANWGACLDACFVDGAEAVDLRRHRIRRALLALRRAGYRTQPPPEVEAHLWLPALDVADAEDGSRRERPIWVPRKETEDWHIARFGHPERPWVR